MARDPVGLCRPERPARDPGPPSLAGGSPCPPARASLQERIEALLNKNRAGGLSDEERKEWERYQYIEHLVRMAKARAIQRQDQG